MDPDEGRNVDQAVGTANTEIPLVYGSGHTQQRVGSWPPAEGDPYPGLAPFQQEQAEWFFGRDRVLTELTTRLAQGKSPLVVVAASGAGKTSLLQAGLIAKLKNGALPGAQHWPMLRMTPTSHPIRALVSKIALLTGSPVEGVVRQLDDPDLSIETLRGFVRQQGEGSRLVVIVDQLEEMFTLCSDHQERRRFVDLITRLASRGPGGQDPVALVVYGLRADFYAQCADFPQLRAALQDNQVFLGPMSPRELREAIERPAQRAGLQIEPGLVELLLRDLGVTMVSGTADGYEAGRLPLLAHALRLMWLERRGHTLTVGGYRSTGGVEHAVASLAERVFITFDPRQQLAARTLLLRLVRIGDRTEDTRQRVPRDELVGNDADHRTARTAVLDAFTHYRLLTQGQDGVEITHDVLLRAWPRLRSWIDADRADNLIRQQLYDAAAFWEREGRDPGALYRGTRLHATRQWASSQPDHGDLSPIAAAFLTMSIRDDARRRTLRLTAPSLLMLSVLALLLVVVMPMTADVAGSGWWWKLALVAVLVLMAAVATAATAASSGNQLLGRCWRALTSTFGLVAIKPAPPPTRDQLERAALHDFSSAYRDVMTELDEILELRATAVMDQTGGLR